MIAQDRQPLDPLTQATVSIAWLIVLNKPFYPLYVWYLVGNGVFAYLVTLMAMPFFLAIPFVAPRSPLAARIMLPLIGTLDTLFETKLFGQASGTELFFAACILLAGLCFRSAEKNWQRGMALFVFFAFLASHHFIGQPWHAWSGGDLAILRNLNSLAVASLTTFVVFRFAGITRT